MGERKSSTNPDARIGDKIFLQEYLKASSNWSQNPFGNHLSVLDAEDRAKGRNFAGINRWTQRAAIPSLKQEFVHSFANESFIKHAFSQGAVLTHEIFKERLKLHLIRILVTHSDPLLSGRRVFNTLV